MSHKLLVKDQQGEREVLLIDTVEVGRDPRCDISVADPLLSRRHAEFVASGTSVIVRDLNSRNGILVNGRKLQEAELRPGDVVQISQLAVTFLSSIDAVTLLAPRFPQRGPDDDNTAQRAVAAPASTGPADEKTSMLTPGEIEAVKAASAARNRPPGSNGTVAQSAGPGNGAKRSGAWSVQVLADDDRTKFVTPQLPAPAAGDVVSGQPEAGAAAEIPGPPAHMVPPGVVASPPRGGQAAGTRTSQGLGIAVGILALAILSFAIGVASTMIWLQPPLTWRWLLVDHVPVAVLLSFVLAVAAGFVVVVALRIAMRRAESGSQTPVG